MTLLRKTITILVSILTVLFLKPLIAQQKVINLYANQYLERDGVNTNISSSLSLIKDEKGFLYLGTQSGIYRFDGSFFKKLSQAGIEDGEIFNLLADKKIIYATTDTGLYRIDPLQNNPDTLLLKKTHRIAKFKEQIWAFNSNKIYTITINPKKTVPDSLLYKFQFNKTSKLYNENNKRLWILAKDTIYAYENGKIENYSKKLSLFYKISSICQDNEGNLWLGGEGAIFKIKDFKKAEIEIYKFNSKKSVETMCFDRLGRLWLGGENLELQIFMKGEFKKAHIIISTGNHMPSTFPANPICILRDDANAIMWVATSNNQGLLKFSDQQFVIDIYRVENKGYNMLAKNKVWEVIKDQDNLLIGTSHEGGLNSINLLTKRTAPHPANLDKDIYALHKEGDDLFIGGEYGLYRIRNAKIETLINEKIWVIRRDGKKRLWIGGTEHLFLYDIQKNTFTTIANGLIWDIFEDSKQKIWIANNSILQMYDEKKDSLMSFDGLFKSNIYTINEYKGKLTIGLDSKKEGLKTFDPETKKVSENLYDGSSLIYNIIKSPKDSSLLWATTEDELLKIDNWDNEKPLTPKKYFFYDLGMVDFNQGASFIDEAGKLYLGNTLGLIALNPDSLYEAQNPIVYIDSVIHMKRLKDFSKGILIEKNEERALQIKFSAIAFNNPNKLKFRYAVLREGNSEDTLWYYTSEGREIQLSLQSYGAYTLIIQTTDNHGFWEANALLKIEIKNKFLEPTWQILILIIVVIVITILLGAFWFKNKKKAEIDKKNIEIEKDKAELKAKELEIERQKAEIEKSNIKYKLKVLQIDNHEIGKMFNIINAQIFLVKELLLISKLITDCAHFIKNYIKDDKDFFSIAKEEELFNDIVALRKLECDNRLNTIFTVQEGIDDYEIGRLLLIPIIQNGIDSIKLLLLIMF